MASPSHPRAARPRTPAPLAAALLLVGLAALAGGRAEAVQERPAPPRPPVTPTDAAPGGEASAPPATPATAPTQAAQPVDIEELRRRIDVLAAEIERLRSGEEEAELTDARRQALGLAPSAAATYRKRQGLSFAGYGEMLYENFDEANERGDRLPRSSQLDFLRVILYSGYRFSDRFVFNSEIELEHANEVSVEFAYIDYLAADWLTLRGGMILVPLGLLNEFHEPTVFLGARRPETESRIIPSTWRENGAGALGTIGRFNYRAYVVNGLNAAGFSADGLRGGRQKGSRARAADLAFAGRLDFVPTAGVFLGGGLYTGGSAQGQYQVDGRDLHVGTTIAELHGQAQVRGLDVRALYAHARLAEVAELNAARGLAGSRSVGSTQRGGYLQVAYNVLSQMTDQTSLAPYYRFERLDTQAAVPAGFASDPARDATFHTFGVEFRPIYNVVVKTDYQVGRNGARTGRNQLNVNLGYAF